MPIDSSLIAVINATAAGTAFRSAIGTTGTTSNHTVSIPTYQPGDLLIYCAAWQNSSRSLATPSGWTVLNAKTNFSYTYTDPEWGTTTTPYGATMLFRRIVQPGASYTTLTAAFGSSTNASHVVVAISGAHQATPVDAVNFANDGTDSNTSAIAVGSVTTTVPDTLGVIFAFTSNPGVNTWPSGWVERADVGNANSRVAAATMPMPGAAGNKNPADAVAAGTVTASGSWLIAVRSA